MIPSDIYLVADQKAHDQYIRAGSDLILLIKGTIYFLTPRSQIFNVLHSLENQNLTSLVSQSIQIYNIAFGNLFRRYLIF